MKRTSLAQATLAAALLCILAANPLAAETPAQTGDICRLLGGRSDRDFSGRPGNLSAIFGAKARLIYMAADLSTKSSLFGGRIVEWRPDFVQLQPDTLAGPEGQLIEGITTEKYCWIGPADSVLAEHAFRNPTSHDQTVRLGFDLQGVEDVKLQDGRLTCKISAGYPRTVVPQLFGALSASHPVTVSKGRMWMDIPIPAGKSVSCVVALAIGADLENTVRLAHLGTQPHTESTLYWNHVLTEEIPTFTCDDPYLEKLYYFRWWSLLTKMNVGGFGHWIKPLAREGTVGFNALISYSGGPNTIDLRWMRSPDYAYGNIQSFYENLHDGNLANHIYPDTLDGDGANCGTSRDGKPLDFPYHNFLVKALADIHALHPDRALLRRLWPALQQATGLYDRELDADRDGLYETYPWSNITGQEWGARFLYFHPYDNQLGYERTWRPKDDADAASLGEKIEKNVVMRPGTRIPRTATEMVKQVDQDRHYRQETLDENCYAYANMMAMSDIAKIIGEKSEHRRWLAAAKRTRSLVLKNLWDPATGFFYDRDGATKQWALVKSPTGFYPFWAGIAKKNQLPIFKHLFNPAEFWTPFPIPSISMDYRGDLRKMGWSYWNWSSWPMTTSHVVDAAARAAKQLDPSLVPGAAEFLRRYTMVHFIKADLNRPCISEYFDPITGDPNAPSLDYAHSYYIDLIMRHVVGIEADPISDEVLINPLDMGLMRLEARNIRVKGHDLNVRWKDGKLTVEVDGRLAASDAKLKPLKIRLTSTVFK